jgi:hypothetical protein
MARARDIADDIIRLRAEGKTYAEIREITGASKSTISYWVGNGNEMARVKSKTYKKDCRQYIIEQKTNNPCVDCSGFYPYYTMQYDHLPQFEKLFNLAKFQTYTNDLEVVKAEIAKCELVCGNCHSHRTHTRRIS